MKGLAPCSVVRTMVLSLACIALFPALASAQAILHAARVGGEIQVSVEVIWIDMPAEYTSVVVQRWTNGLCDDYLVVSPAPMPREVRPPQDPASQYSFSEPVPAENRCFGYVVRAVDGEGGLHTVAGAGEMPFDYVVCGTAIVSRGTLAVDISNLTGPPLFTACAQGCWVDGYGFGAVNFDAVDPATYAPYRNTGLPVDIYGEIFVSDMIPNVVIVASQIVLTPSGECGPVPVQPMSWGSVKTIYR